MQFTEVLLNPWRGHLNVVRHTTLSLLLLILYTLRLTTCRVCFLFEEEMRACAKLYNLPIPNDRPFGYDFGYGSLNETEEMCRTRGHITIFQCMQRVLEKKCRNNAEERYLKIIWSFTLDTRRSEQAASYICKEHNLQIFRRYRHGCLGLQEKKAQVCAQTRNSSMSEVVKALRSESSKSYTPPELYLDRLKLILNTYECKSIKAKLDCLYKLLRDTCHPDATLLILNFFKETLPPGCIFSLNGSPPVGTLSSDVSSKFSQQKTHQDLMSDFPQAKYVNDDYNDDENPTKVTSSTPSQIKFRSFILLLTTLIKTAS
uniref:Uncharacterized protein n=1 Tax=Mesocestoides corti TaxID=53468 RepID=A0A5K3F653_MESCO